MSHTDVTRIKIIRCGIRIERALTTKGWWRTQDKVSCTLLWTEIKRSIDYKSFHEGEQMVNHFPNMKHLTTKIGLLESLRSYYRLYRSDVPGTIAAVR